jgi:hypothetical protein
MNTGTAASLEQIEVPDGYSLADYAEYVELAPLVAELEATARTTVPRLAHRTIWIVSSTSQGGGVAEGLPRIVALLRQLGLAVEWIVIHSSEARFFTLTKRIHNQLHGVSSPRLAASDRELYDEVSDQLAEVLIRKVGRGDILIVHDPQPLGAGARVKRRLGTPALWRCHIGFNESTAAGDDAWQFLMKDVLSYDRSIFTLKDYVPPVLSKNNIAIMTPGIDPLSHKNRQLSVHKTAGTHRCCAHCVDASCSWTAVPNACTTTAAWWDICTGYVSRRHRPVVPTCGDSDLTMGPPKGLRTIARSVRVAQATTALALQEQPGAIAAGPHAPGARGP